MLRRWTTETLPRDCQLTMRCWCTSFARVNSSWGNCTKATVSLPKNRSTCLHSTVRRWAVTVRVGSRSLLPPLFYGRCRRKKRSLSLSVHYITLDEIRYRSWCTALPRVPVQRGGGNYHLRLFASPGCFPLPRCPHLKVQLKRETSWIVVNGRCGSGTQRRGGGEYKEDFTVYSVLYALSIYSRTSPFRSRSFPSLPASPFLWTVFDFVNFAAVLQTKLSVTWRLDALKTFHSFNN